MILVLVEVARNIRNVVGLISRIWGADLLFMISASLAIIIIKGVVKQRAKTGTKKEKCVKMYLREK